MLSKGKIEKGGEGEEKEAEQKQISKLPNLQAPDCYFFSVLVWKEFGLVDLHFLYTNEGA